MRRSRIGYLVEDTFGQVDRAAGAVNGTNASRKGGPRTVVDTGNELSVSNGSAIWGQGTANYDPLVYYTDVDVIDRVQGRMFLFHLLHNIRVQFGGGSGSPPTLINRVGVFEFSGAALRLLVHPQTLSMGTVTDNERYNCILVWLDTGFCAFVQGGSEYPNWTLLYRWILNNSALVIPHFANIGSALDDGDFSLVRIPNLLWLPHPICADTFTRGDGALGNSEHRGPDNQKTGVRTWTGPTWAIDTSQAKNTPTEGAELITDGAFNTACGVNWVCGVGWNIAAGAATHIPGTGSTITEAGIVTPDEWHVCQFDITARVAGGVRGRVGGVNGSLKSTVATHVQIIRAGGATSGGVTCISTFDGSIDNVSIRQLTLSSLFSSLSTSTADTIIRCQVATLVDDTQCGLVARLDDAATPTNFIHLHFDGQGNVVLDEMNGGVYQATIMSVAQAFTADDWLILILDGLTYRAYHETAAGVATLLGSGNVTVDGSAGTLAGMFSTYDGNRINAIEFWARGTQNEYRRLDVF